MSLNKVMLIGNVGKDPEVRYLEGNAQGGNAKVATFPLATSERYRDRNGEQHENTEWHNIVAWRGLADTIERFVGKGTQLYIEGHLRTRSWSDQSGAKRYTTEIIADVVQLLGKRSDNPAAQGQQGGYSQQGGGYGQNAGGYAQQGSYAPRQQAAPAPQQDAFQDAGPTDDLPF